MELLSICVNTNKDEIKKIIDNYINNDYINVKELEIENRYFINFFSKTNVSEELDIDLNSFFSSIIIDIIYKVYLKKIIKTQIYSKCRYLKKEEKEKIINIGFKNLRQSNLIGDKKQEIYKQVYDYLSLSSEIIIDGFINFRLNPLKSFLSDLTDKSIEEYMIQKEYKEFIDILKYFIEIQESKMDLVNVVIKKDKYMLFDENNKEIDNDFFNGIIKDLDGETISEDDLLISSLITIAPKKIVLHVEEGCNDKDIINIIKNVFDEKAFFCTGCKLCKHKITLKKGK